jgi:CBS domain-containing protein
MSAASFFDAATSMPHKTPALAPRSPPSPPLAASAGADGGERESEPNLGLMATPVRTLLRREPVALAPSATILDAARLMRDQRVSSVLVLDGNRLVGILTDRDLRNRVLAAGLDPQRPVAEIQTANPLTVDVNTTAFDAMLLMARMKLNHVPVLDGTRVVGMVTSTDVAERHSTSAVVLAIEIYRQNDVEGLQRVVANVRDLQINLAAADATAQASGRVITAITDAVTIRLLQFAEAQLGPPPVPYAWVAAGSQARREQTARSDQDNCMVLADTFDEALHGAYFEALSKTVCDGLDACGYVHCPGEMMAMTDRWRQPLARWKQYFRSWTQAPEPKALMLTCVFFDLRCVYGQTPLLDELRREALQGSQANGIFLAHMANNALKRRPPLSVFGRISSARSGEHRGTIDIKHLAIAPIVDLARIHALAGGIDAVSTDERLAVAGKGSEMSDQGARDLREALEFLAALRIRHQARQMRAGQTPDSYLRPDELSNFERAQLKDAFKVIADMQDALGQRYQVGRF